MFRRSADDPPNLEVGAWVTDPAPGKGETGKYLLRTATDADPGVVKGLHDLDRSACSLTTPMDVTYLRCIASGQTPQAAEGWKTRLIVDASGAAVGYVLTGLRREPDELTVRALGTQRGTGLAGVLPSTLRAPKEVAAEAMPSRNDLPPPARLRLHLGPDHPVYGLLKEEQVARRLRPYAWYMRVPDVKALLRKITPVLERRLDDVQTAIENAMAQISAAQAASELDANGHAAKAKVLLAQASEEVKLAAEEANAAK